MVPVDLGTYKSLQFSGYFLYMEISVALVLTLGWRNTRQKFDVAVVLISDVGYWLV